MGAQHVPSALGGALPPALPGAAGTSAAHSAPQAPQHQHDAAGAGACGPDGAPGCGHVARAGPTRQASPCVQVQRRCCRLAPRHRKLAQQLYRMVASWRHPQHSLGVPSTRSRWRPRTSSRPAGLAPPSRQPTRPHGRASAGGCWRVRPAARKLRSTSRQRGAAARTAAATTRAACGNGGGEGGEGQHSSQREAGMTTMAVEGAAQAAGEEGLLARQRRWGAGSRLRVMAATMMATTRTTAAAHPRDPGGTWAHGPSPGQPWRWSRRPPPPQCRQHHRRRQERQTWRYCRRRSRTTTWTGDTRAPRRPVRLHPRRLGQARRSRAPLRGQPQPTRARRHGRGQANDRMGAVASLLLCTSA